MTELVGQESVWNECINQFHTPTHIFITGPGGAGKSELIRLINKHALNNFYEPKIFQYHKVLAAFCVRQ